MQINIQTQSTCGYPPPSATARNRRGATLIAALVCLLIVSLVLLSVFKSAIGQRRQLRLEAQQVQAELLAEAGLERAVAKLRKDKTFSGEIWKIEPEQLQSHHTAQVQIKVTKKDDSTTISVVALFPKGSMKESRATKTLVLKQQQDNKQPAATTDEDNDDQPKTDPAQDADQANPPTDGGGSQQ